MTSFFGRFRPIGGAEADAGAVTIIEASGTGVLDARSGSGSGLPAAPAPLFFQGGGLPGTAEAGDLLAGSLSS